MPSAVRRPRKLPRNTRRIKKPGRAVMIAAAVLLCGPSALAFYAIDAAPRLDQEAMVNAAVSASTATVTSIELPGNESASSVIELSDSEEQASAPDPK